MADDRIKVKNTAQGQIPERRSINAVKPGRKQIKAAVMKKN